MRKYFTANLILFPIGVLGAALIVGAIIQAIASATGFVSEHYDHLSYSMVSNTPEHDQVVLVATLAISVALNVALVVHSHHLAKN